MGVQISNHLGDDIVGDVGACGTRSAAEGLNHELLQIGLNGDLRVQHFDRLRPVGYADAVEGGRHPTARPTQRVAGGKDARADDLTRTFAAAHFQNQIRIVAGVEHRGDADIEKTMQGRLGGIEIDLDARRVVQSAPLARADQVNVSIDPARHEEFARAVD
jgi:hypothetical protein